MIPVRPAKRFQSAANVKPDRLKKGLLKGQFLFAPDITIPENDILPAATSDNEKSLILAKKLLNEEIVSNIRRSKRIGITKYKSATSFDSFIESQCEDGIEARDTGTLKGRGVYTTRKFFRNDYIVEYAGELLTQIEAKHRENLYGRNHKIGCYMYYFKWGEKVFCVDATEETNRLGRLINHSRKNSNCQPKVFVIRDQPRLVLVALRDIEIDEELFYDYGERRKDIIEAFPWLNE
ncbi:unnamed protein product [Adineta steineri]|uniref:SET domain-containing protein n=1 Tax=Adineta steineri TaxID=433720 RepID=A0A819EN65_9BILA|nr:unnamed protein product [Adineta steineri]CAF1465098.1 unnamed protein product [Adineta steineri]CAF1626453.1 unnamed protein product [Adineta steineri]CAF3854090.1 unnamed protein product [Adineta steineri]